MSRAAQPQPPLPHDQPPTDVATPSVAETAPPNGDAPAAPAPQPAIAGGAPTQPIHRRFQQRHDGPRRVRDGLKVSTREGPLARTAFAERWLRLIETQVSPENMTGGIDYARSGQIVSLQPLTGRIEAHVQGTAPRPYVTRIGMPSFDESQWQRVIEAMAGEAIHHAKLLSGELPPGLDATLAQLELALLPESAAVTISCTCATGKAGQPCKHAAAAGAMFADQLSNNPLLIFSLLGLPADRLIERLRQARAIHTHGAASAHGEANIPGSQIAAAPLESLIDDFWHGSSEHEHVEWQPPATAVPHALLRRLGPSPMRGRFPMVGLLASIYDAVASEARKRNDDDVGRDDVAPRIDEDVIGGDASDESE